LHNKPLGCGASEVYASGPACEEEEGRALTTVIVTSTGNICIALTLRRVLGTTVAVEKQ